MCGRYTIRRVEAIRLATESLFGPGFEEFTERPRFNVAPSQSVPIVRLREDGARVLSLVMWGLVPSWVKGTPKTRPINARSDTIATNGMFRQAFARRRCLVPADGFYEWQGSKAPKRPFFFHRPDDELFAFAGVWERWKPAESAASLDTFTIITTSANAVVKPIYHRMPVILKPEDYGRWLDRDVPGEDVLDLLKPADDEFLEAYPVSSRVNSVKNNDPSLIEPCQ